ncbi:adenylate kinase [Methanohalophilus levihalophilus]|uniref:adenylate kinase family protein n=1 Tax=Methanohalophilus levihalophilus TaxID=1431282 RepID=UPI001AE5DB3F|nr:adenylate kinase family protein [Methanohalophilus levihalophilus]MBP2031108.1 adenylate kinase [Methanohalophilus levihalophilus]
MFIALTGTPGTGKTSVTDVLENSYGYRVIHLNDVIKSERLFEEVDEDRDCVLAEMDMIANYLEGQSSDKDIIIVDSHLSHHFAQQCIVLRTAPSDLRTRLLSRGYRDRKVEENVEAECLDVILVEAVEMCEDVFEVETTGRHSTDVAKDIHGIVTAISSGSSPDSRFSPGSFNWIEEIL